MKRFKVIERLRRFKRLKVIERLKRIKPIKHCCRECHFLVKGIPKYITAPKESWDEDERREGQIKDKYEKNPLCYRGVWHTSGQETLGLYGERILRETIDKNRKDDCFFVKYAERMSFNGAVELHRIRSENRSLKRSFKIAVWGLYISAVAAFLNFIGLEQFLGWLGI